MSVVLVLGMTSFLETQGEYFIYTTVLVACTSSHRDFFMTKIFSFAKGKYTTRIERVLYKQSVSEVLR